MKTRLPTKGQLAAAAVQDYCRRQGYPVPTKEYQFAYPRRFRFDLAWIVSLPRGDRGGCENNRIALEFQGGSWTGGRHTRGAGFARDCQKFSEAAVRGWRVLLCTHRQMNDGTVFGYLDRIFGTADIDPRDLPVQSRPF